MILDSIDSVVRGPLYATAFMAAASAMLGCVVVCRRQALIGETLSHAAYPGFILGALVAQFLAPPGSVAFLLLPFVSAILCALLAVLCIGVIERAFHVAQDSAQAAILSAAFAVGLLVLSSVQSVFPYLARGMQVLLLGQAATMNDTYVLISGMLFIGIVIFMGIFHRGCTASLFDTEFAKFTALSNSFMQNVFIVLLVTCIMIGIRSMGVVLMTALLVFPAVCARLLSRSFASMVLIAAIIGSLSAVFGVYLAHTWSLFFEAQAGTAIWIPTGPLITLVLGGLFGVVLLTSPQTGLLVRTWRRWRFTRRCLLENTLKIMWKNVQAQHSAQLMKKQLLEACSVHRITLRMLLRRLSLRGYISIDKDEITVTEEGLRVGQRLVRLHRLWELYLVDCCKIPKERVHPTADEMEHLFSEDLERQLTRLLNNPAKDPHDQSIPGIERVVL